MNILGVCIISIISTILSILIKKRSPEFSVVIPLIAASTIILIVLGSFTVISDKMSSLTNVGGLDVISIPLKILGVMLLSKLSSEICLDAGERSISFTVSLAGKVASILIAMPLFEQLLSGLGEIFN